MEKNTENNLTDVSEASEEQTSINPLTLKAHNNNSLSVGALKQFFSEDGIPLPDVNNSVVALYLSPPEGSFKSAPVVHDNNPGEGPRPNFEGGEHTEIGNQVILYFFKGDPGRRAIDVPLRLPNTVDFLLTYGQILALGGDFYGIPNSPISDGRTQADRELRFSNAYNSLGRNPFSPKEAKEILAVMQEEIDAVNNALREGRTAESAYKALGDSLSEKWNRITGGGSVVSPWIPMGRYLKLAAVNWDHFSQCAVMAYEAGHAVALKGAVEARKINDPWERRLALERVYAQNAFADHFLTDLFSSGHMRSPRKELNDNVTPASIGGLLTRYMHDEDSTNGLYVQNKRGNHWKAYGDKTYFDTIDITNTELVNQAAQLSADEIFQTFITGKIPTQNQYAAFSIIPNLELIQDYRNPGLNFAPMFVAENNTVVRRKDLNDPMDFTMTNDWWGFSTLALLKKDYKGPKWQIGPMKPPTTVVAFYPNGWQSTSPIRPNWIPGNAVRYSVSFVDGLNETAHGAWCPYYRLSNKFKPTLTNIPIDPTNTAKARNVYRQFRNQPYSFVGTIRDNTTTVFVDDKN
jgi:hypothetical protein